MLYRTRLVGIHSTCPDRVKVEKQSGWSKKLHMTIKEVIRPIDEHDSRLAGSVNFVGGANKGQSNHIVCMLGPPGGVVRGRSNKGVASAGRKGSALRQIKHTKGTHVGSTLIQSGSRATRCAWASGVLNAVSASLWEKC